MNAKDPNSTVYGPRTNFGRPCPDSDRKMAMLCLMGLLEVCKGQIVGKDVLVCSFRLATS